jgi:hypothetical protein
MGAIGVFGGVFCAGIDMVDGVPDVSSTAVGWAWPAFPP